MNPNSQTASKRNKNRSSSNAINSMSSNVSRTMNRPPSMRNNYSMNLRGDNTNMPQQHQTSRNYPNNNNNSRSMVNSQINSSSTVVPANHQIVEMCSGVYKNKRLFHTMTSLIGCLIEVQLEDGKRYEGILKTFSSEFELALCTAASIVEELSSEKRNLGNNIGNLLAALERNEEVTDTLVIDPKRLVTFKALNVDLDFATKKAAMTDSEIAKHDGTKQQKELVPWVGDDNENTTSGFETLDDGSNNVSNGWNTEDMFKFNESKYNIETSYQEDMSEYTIKLQHRNDEEYRQREARAAKIAKEIEQDSNRLARYNKEDETDEETRYSAVIRSTDEANNLPASSNDNINNNTNNTTNMTASNNPNNSNYHNNYNRNDINHQRDDQRRENTNPRNNPEAMGFRAQNTRSNRNRMGGNRGGPSGPNEANWRDSNRSMQTNRFNHQASIAYPKSAGGGGGGGGSGGGGGGGGGYSGPTAKYMNAPSNQPQQQQQQQPQQQQYPNVASSQAKTYSAVSARSVPNDSNVGSNDNEPIKTYANRSSGGHANNNEDGYQRKPTGQLPQRESFKQQHQQQQQQRPSYSRIVDQQPHHHHPQQPQQQQHHHHHHDIKSPSSSSSIKHFESDLSKTTTSHPTSPSTPTHEPLLKSTSAAAKTEVVTGGKLKHVDESGHHHHHHHQQQQQQQQHQARITSPKNMTGSGVETKKPESVAEAVKKANIKSQISHTKDVAAQQHQPVDSDIKKTDSPSAPISSSSSSPSAAATVATTASNLSNNTGTNTSNSSAASMATTPMQQTSSTVSLSNASAAPSQGEEIAISSKLNPNAKSFTPRTSHPNVILAPHTTPTSANVMQQQQQPPPPPPPTYYPMAVSGAGHISTTPPSIPSTPSMPPAQTPAHFLQYHPNPGAAPHLATHPNHHHQQQQIRFINNNHMQFSYNPMLPQMVPAQYLPLNHHVQHYAPPMQAGVAPAPPASQSSAPPPQQVGANQPNGPPNSQITSHHMITNTTVSNQVGTPNNGQSQPQPMPQPTQSNQSQQSRSHYRSGSKGPSNPNANQQSQPMMRHPHDYSHQNVANVTGQPIMAGAAHGAQHLAPLLYSPTAVAVHPNPNQMHGQQQPQSIGQLATQSGHNQAIPFIYQYPRPLLPGHHPNAMNIALQPGLFQESHLSVFCPDMPSQMVAQTMSGPPPQPMPPQGASMPPQAPTASVGPGGQVPSSSSPTTQGSVSNAAVSQQQQTF